MKKQSYCLSPMLGLVASLLLVSHVSLHGQTAVTQQLEEVNWEELEPTVPSLSQAEFDAQLMNWENLQKVSLQQYLDNFQLFLETSLPRYEMQPYVLAECLWFQVAVLPKFQQVEADGSLDAMMELNMTGLPEVQKLVADFFVQLGEGSLPVHPWSDAVFSLFQQLVQEFPVLELNQQDFLLVKENLPELVALKVEQVFMPVDVSFRNVQLYGGLMALDKLVAQFNEAKASSSQHEGEPLDEMLERDAEQTAESGDEVILEGEQEQEQALADDEGTEADLSLLPLIPGIDWQQVVENQPLMYLLAHSTAGREIYSVLRTYHSGETGASRCEELYQECRKIGEQWGFDLEQLLPSFSAAGIGAVKEDAFVLYCLPSHDLEQITTDLSCVKTLAPVYFSRAVELLRREVSNGGAL
ncbi:MAG: hypothetical protein J6V63_07640 [Spirochaetaceae bacterium]|nr:hypothetical protein [Spirochaetaceae bacterium]